MQHRIREAAEKFSQSPPARVAIASKSRLRPEERALLPIAGTGQVRSAKGTTMTIHSTKVALVLALMSFGLATSARAETILLASLSGNDCSGLFGQGFGNCAIPTVYDADNTPAIIKFNADGSVSEINSALFPTISGDEFSFSFGSGSTGTWTYTPDADDPASMVSFFVAKGGPAFNLFSVGGNSGTWVTPINPANGRPYGLSHLTFYDGATSPNTPAPEPATLVLVGSGLYAASRIRRRKRQGA
jgi:hypothetical protein